MLYEVITANELACVDQMIVLMLQQKTIGEQKDECGQHKKDRGKKRCIDARQPIGEFTLYAFCRE